MADLPFIILPCPSCQVKNRVKSYSAGKVPVCAKCKTPLVAEDENDIHAKYGQNLNNFFDLPDIGLRSDSGK